MKAITEAMLRLELRDVQPEVFVVPEGKILTPAGREYLNQRKIKIERAGRQVRTTGRYTMSNDQKTGTKPEPLPSPEPTPSPPPSPAKGRYVDYETGAFYQDKPEHMTQLHRNVLVSKNHPRIRFRGQLDRLQAIIITAQADIVAIGGEQGVVEDLDDILKVLQDMMRCDVLEEAFENELILGWNHAELRDRSHHPQKYFQIKQMLLPRYTMGAVYARLNLIRTEIRACEVTAVDAFTERGAVSQPGILECLNRLSSALHIMMCKYLGNAYANGENVPDAGGLSAE